MNRFLGRALVCSLAMVGTGAALADPLPSAGQFRSFWGATQSPGGAVDGAAKDAYDSFGLRLIETSSFGFEGLDPGSEVGGFLATGSYGDKLFTVNPFDRLLVSTSTVAGRFATDGQQWAEMSASGTLTMDFSTNPLTSLGFFMTDLGDFESDVKIKLFRSNGSTEEFNVSSLLGGQAGSGNLAFWGFVDDTGTATYNKIEISATLGKDGNVDDLFGIDGIVTGSVRAPNPVPVPGTLALAAAALGLMALRRRA